MTDDLTIYESGKDLILYKQSKLDLTLHVQKLSTSIEDISPETRVLVEGGMYRASMFEMEFDKYGVNGAVWIGYAKLNEEETSPGFTQLFQRKLFGNSKTLEHQGKNYTHQWGVSVGRSHNGWIGKERLLWYHGNPGKLTLHDGFTDLRAEVLKNANIALTTEFMTELFGEQIAAVSQAYLQIFGK
jgi:hypothetical protein